MAWSWLRRRADRPSGPAPAASQPPATAQVRRVDDWQELPAVQRTLEPLSPVAPLDVFTNGLAAHQNPSFLAPLGHRVDPDGPSGLVTGLASVRPGSPIPYAASTALAVPASRKPRPAVQRHAITWSSATAAPPAESSAVDLSEATPSEEVPGAEPGPTRSAASDVNVDGVVTPAPPAPATPIELIPSAAPVTAAVPAAPTAEPDRPTQPTSADPVPTTGQTPVSIDHPEQGAEPESDVAPTEVVVPEPPQAGAGDVSVAPLLGSAPDAMVAVAETGGAAEPASAGSPERTTPLPVSRLAAQAPEAQVVEPAAQRPTISSSTPVPRLQRQLSAVPEGRPRTSVMPAPFTVELPVVTRTEPEPPTGGTDSGPTSEGPTIVGPTLGGPTPEPGLPTSVPPVTPSTSRPRPEPTAEVPLVARQIREPAAPTSSPEPASANPDSSFGSTDAETLDWEPIEATPPLSGFAARIAGLMNPTQAAGAPHESDRPLPPPVQRLTNPATPLRHPAPTHQPAEGQPATPSASSDRPQPPVPSTEPLVVPTVGRETPLVQRASYHTADPTAVPSAVPVPAQPDLPTAPVAGEPPLTPGMPQHSRGFSTPTRSTGTASGTASPVVARLAESDPAPASHADGPNRDTVTAALVSHRPPLAVRSDLSSAVAPPTAVQRVSFSGPGQPSTTPRSAAPTAVSRTPAPIGAPVRSQTTESPVGVDSLRQAVADEPPVVVTSVTTGHAGHRMEPIPVQRRPPLPAMPAESPPVPPTTGAARSFAAMFGSVAAGQAEDQPGYTTVQLQTAESSSASPPPVESTAAAPAAEPPSSAAPEPTAAPGVGTVATPPAAGAAAADLDEMARRLFEPLSARLRAELWLDRERAGLVTDARY